LSENDLKVKLVLKANPTSGPFGQKLDVLKQYNHLLVYIPFVDKRDTLDGEIILKNLKAIFSINGEKNSQIDYSDNFEMPLSDGNKPPSIQLNKNNIFRDIF
jgi:hypothetical protein